MKLNGLILDEWFLRARNHKSLPRGIDYKARYTTIREVAKTVHRHIVAGGLMREMQKPSGERISLTYHDNRHFEKVMEIVSEIVSDNDFQLSPYEVFFLISAVQVHDIGNVLDRANHQKTARDIFFELLPPNAVLDTIETNLIFSIAEAHTSSPGEDKDTITGLGERTTDHNGKRIQIQLLAAILRFADELADDPDRSFMLGVKHGTVEEGSHLHHHYANSLKSTRIENKSIKVIYRINRDEAIKKFNTSGTATYLLDYIFQRTIKMHLERVYCQRYMQPLLDIHSIKIVIVIDRQDYNNELFRIEYRLVDRGYPEVPGSTKDGLRSICEDPEAQLNCKERSEQWTGQVLSDLLSV